MSEDSFSYCKSRKKNSFLGSSHVLLIKLLRKLLTGGKKKKKQKFNNMYTSCIHRTYPENLSYFLKYRNPHLKYCLQLNTKENVGGTGSVNKWSYEEKHSKQE